MKLDLTEIEKRIKEANTEMVSLTSRYDAMVAEWNQKTQDHQNTLAQYQQRYQQQVGAVAALEQLKRLLTDDGNNGEADTLKVVPKSRLQHK